jgi:hypothetical protein
MGTGYTTEAFHRQRLIEIRNEVAKGLRDLADRVEREEPRGIRDEANTAYCFVDFVQSIDNDIRWGVASLGLHKFFTSLATLAYTETANAQEKD